MSPHLTPLAASLLDMENSAVRAYMAATADVIDAIEGKPPYDASQLRAIVADAVCHYGYDPLELVEKLERALELGADVPDHLVDER
jgi:hypothetical protein